MLKIGYKASAEQFTPEQLLSFAQQAERCQFDSVWISDHFQPWRHTGGHAPAALPWLGALAATTRQIELGTSVLTPTFRHHPSMVAQAFATLGCLAPGRVVLGVGSGESLNETPATGQVWPDQSERSARLREAIKLIRTLWCEERVDFEGKYYRTERATIYDRPAEEVRIFVAAAGPYIAKVAGIQGDGFICTSGKPRDLYTEKLLPGVQQGLQESSRPATQPFERMIEMKVSFDTDPAQALADTRFWGALALRPEEKMNVEDPLKMEALADELPIERAASRWIVSADPDEVVDCIAPYVDMGFDHLVFHAPGSDQARFIELFSSRVMPLLRRKFG